MLRALAESIEDTYRSVFFVIAYQTWWLTVTRTPYTPLSRATKHMQPPMM